MVIVHIYTDTNVFQWTVSLVTASAGDCSDEEKFSHKATFELNCHIYFQVSTFPNDSNC